MSSRKRLKCIYLGFGNHAQKYADTFKFLNIKISIDYLGKKPITMNFNFKSMKLKTITLEKIYLEKKGKMKLILNENKINKFKPGLLNLTKNIVRFVSLKKQNDLIPNVTSLMNLYKTLSLLKK